MEIIIFRILSPILYAITAYYYLLFFNGKDNTKQFLGRIFFSISLIVHSVLLLSIFIRTQHLPIAGAFQALTTFMWIFALLSKLIILRKKEHSLGVFHAVILFLFQSIAMIFLNIDSPLPDILKNFTFEIHVMINLVAYAAFSSAFLAGVMYTLLFHEFQGHKLGYFYDRLPSLSYLEKVNNRSLVLGFVFNTLGILLGAITGKFAWGEYWSWDPKLVTVIVIWLVYGIAVLGTLLWNWKGHRIAYFSLTGFFLIIFSMLIITNYFSKVHSFN